MSKKLETLAMVDVAEELLRASNKPMLLQELFKQIAEIKNISLENIDKFTQLYMDITQSGKFVYCGDDQWNLKEGNLHLWDDDGSSFIEFEEDDIDDTNESDLGVFDDEDEDEDDESIIDDEDEDDDLDEQTKEEIKEEKEYLEVELPLTSTDDDDIDFDADDYDEDDYNKIMDNYENMYDE